MSPETGSVEPDLPCDAALSGPAAPSAGTHAAPLTGG